MKKNNLISVFLTMMIPMFLYGQVVGTVTDTESNPLAGADVVVQGTDLGSAADAVGAYSIDLGAGTYTITASSIGYASHTVEVVVVEGTASTCLLYTSPSPRD